MSSFSRFERDASSLKKEVLERKVEQLGCSYFVRKKNTSSGKEVVTKEALLRALAVAFLRKDFPGVIPLDVADSLLYSPALCQKWDGKENVWKNSNFLFEPLYTGFRATVSLREEVVAFSRFVTDQNFRRPKVCIPEKAIKDLREMFSKEAVLDVIYVADEEEVSKNIESAGVKLSGRGNIDTAVILGSLSEGVLRNTDSFRMYIIDIMELGEDRTHLRPLIQRKQILDEVPEAVCVKKAEYMIPDGSGWDAVDFYYKCLEFTDGCAVKEIGSGYVSGSRDWIKLKNLQEYGENVSVQATSREGSASVIHPVEGVVQIARNVQYGGNVEISFRGGIPVMVNALGGRPKEKPCMWKRGEGPPEEPFEVSQDTIAVLEKNVLGGVTLESLLG